MLHDFGFLDIHHILSFSRTEVSSPGSWSGPFKATWISEVSWPTQGFCEWDDETPMILHLHLSWHILREFPEISESTGSWSCLPAVFFKYRTEIIITQIKGLMLWESWLRKNDGQFIAYETPKRWVQRVMWELLAGKFCKPVCVPNIPFMMVYSVIWKISQVTMTFPSKGRAFRSIFEVFWRRTDCFGVRFVPEKKQ